MKGAAAYRINEEIKPNFRLKWQEGYGVVTLRKDEIEKVSRYIDNQETHHRSGRLSDSVGSRPDGDKGQLRRRDAPLKGAKRKKEDDGPPSQAWKRLG